MMTATGFAATIIKDPVLFYSIYHNPDTVIDFIKLKDGTAFDNIPDSYTPKTKYLNNPDSLIVYTGERDGRGGFSFVAVRSQAFSENWSFKGVHPTNPKIFREQVIWFDQGITTGSFEIIISSTTHHSQPFAILTEKGFIGIIPSSPQETRFIFEDIHIISSFETGFSLPDVIPRPPSDQLFLKKLHPRWI
jgi:hypothetical protein